MNWSAEVILHRRTPYSYHYDDTLLRPQNSRPLKLYTLCTVSRRYLLAKLSVGVYHLLLISSVRDTHLKTGRPATLLFTCMYATVK